MMFNFFFFKMNTSESKVKRLINTILKKLEIGKPFNITFNGDKAHINQQRIDSIKSVNGGFLLPLLGTIISHIKSGSGFENKQGGVLPLLTLLPLIFGGIAAAGGTAGGIASAVSSANSKAKGDLELQEQRRHNKAIEKAAHGEGIFLNPYKGKALKDILTPIVDKIDGLEQEGKNKVLKAVKSLKPFFKIFEDKQGNGLYLQPK